MADLGVSIVVRRCLLEWHGDRRYTLSAMTNLAGILGISSRVFSFQRGVQTLSYMSRASIVKHSRSCLSGHCMCFRETSIDWETRLDALMVAPTFTKTCTRKSRGA